MTCQQLTFDIGTCTALPPCVVRLKVLNTRKPSFHVLLVPDNGYESLQHCLYSY